MVSDFFFLLSHSEERGEKKKKVFKKWIILPFNSLCLFSSSWRPQCPSCFLLDNKISATAWTNLFSLWITMKHWMCAISKTTSTKVTYAFSIGTKNCNANSHLQLLNIMVWNIFQLLPITDIKWRLGWLQRHRSRSSWW